MSPSRRGLPVVMLLAAVGLVMADGALGPEEADACTIAGFLEHEIDLDDPDAVAPGAVSIVSVDVRELGAEGGCSEADSCSGIGMISMIVSAEDDATPPESLGFTMKVVSGTLPPDVTLPLKPVRGFDVGDGNIRLTLTWDSAGPDALDFVVRVSAVDEAGNIGASADVPVFFSDEGCEGVGLDDEGDDESGCAAGGVPASGAVWLLAALAAMFVRARRQTTARPR